MSTSKILIWINRKVWSIKFLFCCALLNTHTQALPLLFLEFRSIKQHDPDADCHIVLEIFDTALPLPLLFSLKWVARSIFLPHMKFIKCYRGCNFLSSWCTFTGYSCWLLCFRWGSNNFCATFWAESVVVPMNCHKTHKWLTKACCDLAATQNKYAWNLGQMHFGNLEMSFVILVCVSANWCVFWEMGLCFECFVCVWHL